MDPSAVFVDTFDSLHNATRRAFEFTSAVLKHASPDRAADEAQQLVVRAVLNTLRECAREHNSRVPVVARLPNELLVEIFACLPMADRIATSHVCYAWRKASLDSRQRLWSVIEGINRPWALDALLSRAEHSLVAIKYLLVQRHTQAELAEIIGYHLAHIVELHVELELDDWKDDWWEEWDYVFNTPAPRLHTLTIEHDGIGTSAEFQLPSTLFSGNVPNLRVLRLVNGFCNFDCIAQLQTVEQVVLSSYSLCVSDIMNILRELPRLRNLRVQRCFSLDPPVSAELPVLPSSCLEKLFIDVRTYDIRALESLASGIIMDKIPVVHFIMLSRSYSPLNARLTASLFSPEPVIQSISFKLHTTQLDMRTVDSTGLVRIFVDVAFTSNFIGHFASIMRTVPELTLINALTTLPQLIWEAFPAIKVLTLVENIESFSNLDNIRFPDISTIETLRFSSQQTDSLMPMLAAFLGTLPESRKLNTLELHGTSTAITELIDINNRASDVKVYPVALDAEWEREAPY